MAHFELEEIALADARNDILAVATGRDPGAEQLKGDESGSPSENKAQRMHTLLSSWVDDVDTEPEFAFRDALADVAHFARSKGIDLRDVLPGAISIADEESKTRNGWPTGVGKFPTDEFAGSRAVVAASPTR